MLSLFPAKCRALILPGVQAVHRTLAGKPTSAKSARTVRNRRLHYFLLCHHLNLTDDWLLENQPQDRANVQLAMYATHLATGSTLHFRSIKASTIAAYLHDVATFLGRFRSIDPRFISSTDTKLAPVISKVLEEQRRWESVPHRREPFTLELHKEIATLPTIALDDCCLDAAMTNWTLCNLYAGCRGVEWAQTSSSQRYLSTFLRNRFQHAYAFTPADVLCFTDSSLPVSITVAIAKPSLVGKIKLLVFLCLLLY